MDYAILSLVFLVITIAIGVYLKLNVGLVAFLTGYILVKISGLPEASLIQGFNSGLFIMICGTMFLFGIAQTNGTMELLARKILALSGRNTKLIPLIMYFVSVIISAIGPGSIPTLILMSALSMSLAKEMKIEPIQLAPLAFLGTGVGGVSPVATNGIIVNANAELAGVGSLGWGPFVASFFTYTILVLI